MNVLLCSVVLIVAILQVGEVRKKILLYSSLLFSSQKKNRLNLSFRFLKIIQSLLSCSVRTPVVMMTAIVPNSTVVKPLRGKRSLASCGNSGGRCTRYGGLNQGTSTMSIIFTSNDLEGNWKVMVNNHFLMKIGRLPRWSQIHLPLPSWTYLCGDGAERNPPGRSRGLSNTVLRQEMAVISFSIMYILHMREEYSVCSTTLDFFHVLCEIKLILDQK